MFEHKTEEVVESINSSNPYKYRYLGTGEDEDADQDFNWLAPHNFVEKYKQSKHYKHVLDTIEETNRDLYVKGTNTMVNLFVSCVLSFSA